MKLKPLAPLLCLFIAVPDLSIAAGKTVYGLSEYARINDPGTRLAAKLDTGTKTASLSARGIKHFKRDGKTQVCFCLATNNINDTLIRKPLTWTGKIKHRHGNLSPDEGRAYTTYPVIELRVCIGKTIRTVRMNLTGRSTFQYPLLTGSGALEKFDTLVDPNSKCLTGKPDYKPGARLAK